jgi:tyrosyl-tRNA synthetase
LLRDFIYGQKYLKRRIAMPNINVLPLLESREYVYQCTNYEKLSDLFNAGDKMTFYLGIDPTADSLHIGHFFALMMFRYLQDAGHRGILVIGGATALIGDPSGKSDMRQMLSKEQVQCNLEEVKELAKRFIKTDGDNPAIILNNAEWINQYTYVDFMRLIGVHFNINTMLSADAYANRLKEGGLTFLEMGYMLMQAFDFVYLHEKYDCILQIGGSDQWGNIVAGTSLNRKMRYFEKIDTDNNSTTEILGLTCPLLLTREGNKMGKTESGTLWVAREKTTAFDFYQYFYNVDDSDVEMLLKLFTHISLDEIKTICGSDIIQAKRVMAYEITKLVHGNEEAEKVLAVVESLFAGEASGENAPESEYTVKEHCINVVDLFLNAGFVESKSEIRRLIQQNGAMVDGEKCVSPDDIIKKPDGKSYVLLKKGKKNFLKVRFE